MALRIAAFTRKLTTFRPLKANLKEPLEIVTEGHDSNPKMWKTLFFVLCVPAIAIAYINTTLIEEPPRPEFVKYSYMRIRNKKFPWGDGNKTLFHNPHVNALPDGYEE